ncbi:MAG: hypothetical protein HUJ56_06780 [Erysipelotrichaceae bacterium]|nr:hypothetical protein [Erysipelotrichaceae bacterium]
MRTKYSFYNFLVSLITSVILPVVGFIKYRLFIDLYGSEINGLTLTIAQFITFLNICEIAYSLAFRQLLFKPLAEDDKETVLKIYYGARKVFKITGIIVISLGAIGSLFFPFFSESPFGYLETVLTFIFWLLPYGLSYFLMGPNFVIIADQKEYRINIFIQSIAILRMVVIVVGILLKLPFAFVVVVEGVNVLGSNIIAHHIALKNYPWLKEKREGDASLFLNNAKYTIIQRLSTLATNNTDNLVISYFMGYGMVSVYGAYSYLNEAVVKIVQSAITSPINSFGNLFNDKGADSYGVFTEFFNFACYIASISSICIFIVMNQFVHLWVAGREGYDVTVLIALLFAVNIFYLTMREPIIISRDANGLFKDAKNNAYLLAISKVVLSVVFIQWWGITGVLLATLLTNWLVDFLYNPKLVYTKVFNLNVMRYYKMVFSRLLVAAIIGLSGYLVWNHFYDYVSGGWIHFIISCMILGISVVVLVTGIYWFAYESFRNLIFRFLRILKVKVNKA